MKMTDKEFMDFIEEEIAFNGMSKQIADKIGINTDEVYTLKTIGKLKLK